MGCGKSKQAVATVDNTSDLTRKKSNSRSKSLRDVDQSKHNVAAGTNENNPTDKDIGNKASEVKQKENENGGNSGIVLSQKKPDGGSKDLKDGNSSGNDGEGKYDSNGNVASEVEEKENANGSNNVHAGGVNNDIKAKTEVMQKENKEGTASNKIEEDGFDHGDKKNQEVTVIINEKTESGGKFDEKVEFDIPSHEAPKEDSVAENVKMDDALVEEENKGDETKEEVANEDAAVNKEIKQEQATETDNPASTMEETAIVQEQPESSSSIKDVDTN